MCRHHRHRFLFFYCDVDLIAINIHSNKSYCVLTEYNTLMWSEMVECQALMMSNMRFTIDVGQNNHSYFQYSFKK